MDSNWSINQRKYQFWLAVPPKDRPSSLRSRGQVAKALRVSEDTLALWESLPGWWNSVHEHALSVLGQDLSEILAALSERAKEGNISAIKLSLQALGVFTEKTEAQVSHHHDQLMVVVSAASADTPGSLPNTDQSDQPKQLPTNEEQYRTIDHEPRADRSDDTADTADTADEERITDLIFVRRSSSNENRSDTT